jgi:uncharacterized caspase-like protein
LALRCEQRHSQLLIFTLGNFGEAKVRFLQFFAVTSLALACAVAPAYAEKRVALVVGNNRYANLGANEQLQKAVNDARAMGGALRQLGFDVIPGENLDRRALTARLDELMQRLVPGDIAFFFFSGHGVAVDGINYILPADMPDLAGGQETRLKAEALAEPYIISELTSRGVRVAVVVLDACRTNPFSRPGGKAVGGARGLAPPQQVQGVFALYAAGSGQVALDRLYDGDPSPNSVFSRVLVPALTRPGVDLATLAIEVREEVAQVAQTAGHAQQPAYYDQIIGGRVYLNGGPARPAVSDAERTWGIVQNTTSLAVLDDFIRQYGNTPVYGALARARRDELAKVRQVITIPAVNFASQQNVAAASGSAAFYGDVILNAPPYISRPNAAEWNVNTSTGGRYKFEVQVAAAEPRPVTIFINGTIWRQSALNSVTGGWTLDYQRYHDLGLITLRPGVNVIAFHRDDYFPHIRTLRFTPVD